MINDLPLQEIEKINLVGTVVSAAIPIMIVGAMVL